MARYSTIKIKALLAESDKAATSDLKGAKLEELVAYLFGKLRGVCLYGQNSFNLARSRELDLVFTINRNYSDLHFLDAILPVECKNTNKSTSSSEVNWFANKVSDMGIRMGVLVSLYGVSGSDGNSNGQAEIRKALSKFGVSILVLNRAELLSLATTEQLAALLLKKYNTLCIEDKVLVDVV